VGRLTSEYKGRGENCKDSSIVVGDGNPEEGIVAEVPRRRGGANVPSNSNELIGKEIEGLPLQRKIASGKDLN